MIPGISNQIYSNLLKFLQTLSQRIYLDNSFLLIIGPVYDNYEWRAGCRGTTAAAQASKCLRSPAAPSCELSPPHESLSGIFINPNLITYNMHIDRRVWFGTGGFSGRRQVLDKNDLRQSNRYDLHWEIKQDRLPAIDDWSWKSGAEKTNGFAAGAPIKAGKSTEEGSLSSSQYATITSDTPAIINLIC